MTPDYLGPDGGRLGLAFAAGCIAAFGFLSLIGKFIWSMIGKAKDDEITRLKAEMEADRKRCTEMEVRLVTRIQQLEGYILALAPPSMRDEIRRGEI